MCNILNDILIKHLKDLENKPFSRNHAWHLCYQFFKDNYKEIIIATHTQNNEKQNILDFAALNLAYYLINWGMGRNKVISNHNYRIYRELIVDLFIKSNLHKDVNQENLDNAKSVITKWYQKYIHDDNKKNEEPWESLSTLIIMGIFGNVPAFTSNFKKGIKKHNRYRDKHKYKKRLQNIYNFENIEALKEFNKQENIYNDELVNKWSYTREKLIDTCFYELGKQMK